MATFAPDTRGMMNLFPTTDPRSEAAKLMGQSGATSSKIITTPRKPGRTAGGALMAGAGGTATAASIGALTAAKGATGLAAVGGPFTLAAGAAIGLGAYLLS